MDTDRPDVTESPVISKHNYLQIEIGMMHIRDASRTTNVIPTVLTKYGLSRKIELRLVTEVNAVQPELAAGHKFQTGFLPILIGGKIALFEEKKLRPQTSLLTHLGISSIASKKFQSTYLAPGFVLAMQNTITSKIGIGYNAGVEWDGESLMPFWIYSVSTGFDLGRRWTSFIEIFGAAQNDRTAASSIDAGFGFYINSNLKLDASAGVGISKEADDGFFGFGISYRFPVKNKNSRQ
jgi:hypothetical protein